MFSPVGIGVRPSSRSSNHSWPALLMRHFGRRPLGNATSLPAMLNLGVGYKVEEVHGRENGSDKEPEPEKEVEGEKCLACYLTIDQY